MHSQFVKLFEMVVVASLLNGFVFTRFLGLGVLLAPVRRLSSAIGMGAALTSLMMLIAGTCWCAFAFFLRPHGVLYLAVVVYMAVAAGYIFFGSLLCRALAPPVARALIGESSLLVTINTVTLAVPLIATQNGFSLLKTVSFGLGSGLGLSLALVIVAGINEWRNLADPPRSFRGLPIAIIIAGMIAIALTGLAGVVTVR